MRYDRTVRSLAALISLTSVAAAEPLPAHYAAMFERGKTWVYDTSVQYFGGEQPARKHTDRDKVTCTVANVSRRSGAEVAFITCDKELRKLEVAGYWVANATGLWHAIETPDLTELFKEPPRILAKPVAFERTRKIEFLDPKHDTVTTGVRASPKINGWCTYEDSSNADPDGGRVVTCFAPGIGIQSGYNDIGGELNKFEFTAR